MSNFRLFPFRLTGDDTLKHTVRVSIVEGAFAQVFTTLSYVGSVFISKYALHLQATPMQLALLAAIAQLAQVFQLGGLIITRRSVHRRKPTLILAGLGRMAPLFAGFLLPWAASDWAIWVFLGLMLLACGFSAMSGNIWVAWVNDLVPARIRGRFFSLRSQFHLAVGLVTGYLCSLLVDAFTAPPDSLLGGIVHSLNAGWLFRPSNTGAALAAVITAGAFVALLGLVVLARQPERTKEPDHRHVWSIITDPLRNPNFRRLLVFNLWWMLALGVGSAYWQPFMIKTLRMTTLEITLYGTVASLSMLVFVRQWGRFIDRYGNKTTIKIAIVLGSINPALWCFVGPGHYWLLWVEAVGSGLMWSAMGIVGTNFVLSLAPKGRAQAYFAVYSAVSGLGMMFTTILSGQFFPPALVVLGHPLTPEQVLFGLTALLRLTAEIPLHWVKEPRAVPLNLALRRVFASGLLQTRSVMNKVFRIRL